MAEITEYAPGTFCWIDSGTDDLAEARAFYEAVFGWDYAVADETGYLMCRQDGRPVAGLYALNEDMLRLGAMPYWLAYVAVTDADAALAAAGQAGGRPVGPAFDVPGLGRGGAFFDPAGGLCGVWQAGGHRGAGLIEQHGALSWTELQVREPRPAGDFYCSVFGWSLEEVPMPDGAYYLFKDGDTNRAGMIAIPPTAGDVPPVWAVYFGVDDTDATVAAAQAASGTLVVPATPISTRGRFAVLCSADGAHFSVLQAVPME
jgi:predicted enzyme related to lactoylglutathione lyase